MSLPASEHLPPESGESFSPARRRRKRRMILPSEAGERAAYLKDLAQRVTPSLDFFLFSLLAGLILGGGLLLEVPVLFLLAVLAAPFMAPALGLSLAAVVGSGSFFLQALGGIGVGSLLVFASGALAGWAARFFSGLTYQQALFHARFSWLDMIVLTIGAALTAYLTARTPQQRPMLGSAMVAYALYLPVGVAGFGLTAGVAALWPDGLMVFAVHLAWTIWTGILVLAVLGVRPKSLAGYTLSGALALAGAAILLAFSGLFPAARDWSVLPSPTHTPTSTVPAPTLSATPRPPTVTPTATRTLLPTRTPTLTVSPEPTPVWARVDGGEVGGVVIREEPDFNGKWATTLMNGALVEVLPETRVVDKTTWVRVRMTGGAEGWIVRSLLVTATPGPP